jgi:site-specific DNA-methyltransferase (adenine-specific)
MPIKKEVTIGDCRLIQGDCLEVMPLLGKVDMVLVDPPYGTTACKWDSIIPLEQMWAQLKEITEPTAAIVMTASQPFTTKLIASNYDMFKYCWVWEKSRPTGMATSSFMPMKYHEDVCVFVRAGKPIFNKQLADRSAAGKARATSPLQGSTRKSNHTNMGDQVPKMYHPTKVNPKSIVVIGSGVAAGKQHPTQKPVALMAYFINTYTNTGDTVLDFTMGSASTLVACAKMGRAGIGIELDPDYFEIACERVRKAYESPDMFIEAAKVKPEQSDFKL